MALTTLEAATISRGISMAAKLLSEVKEVLDELNVIYDSQGGVKSTVTQQNLDAVASLSGLTKAQLDDGMFVLTSTLKGALANGYTQLVGLASRSDR